MIRLQNGNFKELIKAVADKSVDLIVTDPPYKTTKRGNSGGTGGMCKNSDFIKGKGGFKENAIEFKEWLPDCFRVLKEDSHAYFMTNNKNLKSMLIAVEDAGFKVFKTLIWAKDNCITNMWYMDSHEYIIFARKGKAKKINNCGTRSVLNIPNVKNKVHPSEKPVELMDILVGNSSIKDDETFLMFDPFMGSGSCAISAMKQGIGFLGFELDNQYFKEAEDNVEIMGFHLAMAKN